MVTLAMITWPPPAISIPWTAVPATIRWSQRQDMRTIATSFRPPVPGRLDHRLPTPPPFDGLDLRGFGLANFAALDPFMSQVGADTVIALNGADILTLKNINEGTLVANDFLLV